MKSLIFAAIFISASWNHCLANTTFQDGSAPDDLRFVFEGGDSDLPAISEEERSIYKEKIRTTSAPDFSNRIYDLVWDCMDKHAVSEMIKGLSALGWKADLEPEKLKKITDHMWLLVNRGDYNNLDVDDKCFLIGGVVMLSGFPGHDHEDLALKILENAEWLVKKKAAVTLGEIGTRKSLESMKKIVAEDERRIEIAFNEEAARGAVSDGAKKRKSEIATALVKLERRINSIDRRQDKDALSSTPSEKKDREALNSNPVHSKEYIATWSTFALAAAGALVTFLLVCYSRGRKKAC